MCRGIDADAEAETEEELAGWMKDKRVTGISRGDPACGRPNSSQFYVLSKDKTGDNLALLNQYLQLMSAHMGGMKASYC